jgi:hypothetical protein
VPIASLRSRVTLASLVTRAVAARLAGLWLALTVLGAVLFGPNGLYARDVTRGLWATPWVAVALSALWSLAHLRVARITDGREFDFTRALPLSTLDRALLLRAPTWAPHALVGAFFARAEGAAVGLAAAITVAMVTAALRALALRVERVAPERAPSPRGLLVAHLRWGTRADPSALARSLVFASACTLLATLAVANTRVSPVERSSLATVLLLVASGAISAAVTTVVSDSERSLALWITTQPDATKTARAARRAACWALPAMLGGACAALATSPLGAAAAGRAGLSYAAQWLAVAMVVERGDRRGIRAENTATAATIAWVLAALVGAPRDTLVLSAAASAIMAITARTR